MTVWTRKAAEWNSRCFDAKRGRGALNRRRWFMSCLVQQLRVSVSCMND